MPHIALSVADLAPASRYTLARAVLVRAVRAHLAEHAVLYARRDVAPALVRRPTGLEAVGYSSGLRIMKEGKFVYSKIFKVLRQIEAS